MDVSMEQLKDAEELYGKKVPNPLDNLKSGMVQLYIYSLLGMIFSLIFSRYHTLAWLAWVNAICLLRLGSYMKFVKYVKWLFNIGMQLKKTEGQHDKHK